MSRVWHGFLSVQAHSTASTEACAQNILPSYTRGGIRSDTKSCGQCDILKAKWTCHTASRALKRQPPDEGQQRYTTHSGKSETRTRIARCLAPIATPPLIFVATTFVELFGLIPHYDTILLAILRAHTFVRTTSFTSTILRLCNVV